MAINYSTFPEEHMLCLHLPFATPVKSVTDLHLQNTFPCLVLRVAL